MSPTESGFRDAMVDRVRLILTRLTDKVPPGSPAFREREKGRLVGDHEVLDLDRLEPVLACPELAMPVLDVFGDPIRCFKGGYCLNDPELLAYCSRWLPLKEQLEALGGRPVHVDDFGTLYKAYPLPSDGDDDCETCDYDSVLAVVEVLNATPEPDGTFRNYFLRVPPEMTTARGAVAWTFGIADPATYCPDCET